MLKFLEVSNFEVLEGVFEFGKKNTLKGRNGSGKTAIGRAILWLHTGRDVTGSQTTEHLRKDRDKSMTVKAMHEDGVSIERRMAPGGSKTILVNGEKMSQEEFEKVMPVDWQTFASVFFVGFFERMTETDQRSLFMRITPKIDRSELFNQMVGEKYPPIDWSKPMKKLHDEWNQMRLVSEKRGNELKGKMELLIEQRDRIPVAEIEAHESMVIAEEKTLSLLKKEIAELEKKQTELTIWKMKKKTSDAALEENERTERRNQETKDKRVMIEAEIEDLTPQDRVNKLVEDGERCVSDLKKKLDSLLGSERRLRSEYSLIKQPQNFDEKCPTCQRKLADSTLEKLKKENDERRISASKVESHLIEIERQISDVKIKINDAELSYAESKNSETKRILELKTKMGGLRARLEYLKPIQLKKVEVLGPEPEVTVIGLPIIQKRAENVLKNLDEARKNKFEAEMARDRKNELSAEVTRCQKAIEVEKIQTEMARTVADALHPVRGVDGKILEMKLSALNLPEGLEIDLVETQKNGELSDCFKEKWKGVPFKDLSAGERIKTSLKMADVIDSLVSKAVSMHFIDDADLLDSLPDSDSDQLFVARVETDKELVVEKS